ncbi:MAG: alpha/beta hydrolase [Chloroflexota bacterium]
MKRWQKTLLIILAVILGIVLIGPFLIPVPALTDTVPAAQLTDSDSKFIKINGLNVHYKEVGQGDTTFILLHGFGASVFSWHEVLQPFSQYGRVIAYDRPAFGLTDRPMPGEWTGESPYSSAANVEMLAGLMDALNVEKAVLIGNSAGGSVSVAFALKYPERVQALILVDPALGDEGGRFPSWLLSLMATPQMRHVGPLLVRNIAQTGNDTIRQAWHDPSLVTDEIIAGYRKPLKANNWDRALYEFTIASRPLGLKGRFVELKMPVIVVAGDDDRIIPTAYSIQAAQDIPGAQLAILPGCGHVPHEECPTAFMDAMVKFLESVKLK